MSFSLSGETGVVPLIGGWDYVPSQLVKTPLLELGYIIQIINVGSLMYFCFFDVVL